MKHTNLDATPASLLDEEVVVSSERLDAAAHAELFRNFSSHLGLETDRGTVECVLQTCDSDASVWKSKLMYVCLSLPESVPGTDIQTLSLTAPGGSFSGHRNSERVLSV